MQEIGTDFFKRKSLFRKIQLPLCFGNCRKLPEQDNIVSTELQSALDDGLFHLFERQLHFKQQIGITRCSRFIGQMTNPVDNRRRIYKTDKILECPVCFSIDIQNGIVGQYIRNDHIDIFQPDIIG